MPAHQLLWVTLPAGWHGDWHPAPARQLWVGVEGHLDVTVSDGETRRFGPGSLLLLEDVTGKGHVTKAVSDTPAEASSCNSTTRQRRKRSGRFGWRGRRQPEDDVPAASLRSARVSRSAPAALIVGRTDPPARGDSPRPLPVNRTDFPLSASPPGATPRLVPQADASALPSDGSFPRRTVRAYLARIDTWQVLDKLAIPGPAAHRKAALGCRV
jgi:hypothetical protein